MNLKHINSIPGFAGLAMLILALAAAGCGGTSQPAQQAAPATTPQPAQAAAEQAAPATARPPIQPSGAPADAQAVTPAPTTEAAPATTPAPATTAGTPATAPPPTRVTELVQDFEVGGVQVVLIEARRTSGDTVTVKWQYRNTTSQEVKIAKGGTSWADPYQLTAEAYLIDPVNKKKYMVIRDSQNYWLASKHGDWQGVKLAAGQTLNAWAKFPAPPAGVDRVSVNIPGAPPFDDVPVVK